ncbi:DUF4142 domain-containing protein [Sphingomonas oryzagri]
MSRSLTSDSIAPPVNAAALSRTGKPAPPAPRVLYSAAPLRRDQAASGKTRDTLYVGQHKLAHAAAQNLMQSYASSGTAINLKRTAGQIVPIVQVHKDMIDKM